MNGFDTADSRLQQLSGSIERVIYANEETAMPCATSAQTTTL